MARPQSAASKINRLMNEIAAYKERLKTEKNIYWIERITESISGRRDAIAYLKKKNMAWNKISKEFKIDGAR